MNKVFFLVLSFSLVLCISCGTKSDQQNPTPQNAQAKPAENPAPPPPPAKPPEPAKTVEAPASQPAQPQQPAPIQPEYNTAADPDLPPFHEVPDAVPLKATLDPASVEPAAQAGYVVAQKKPKLLAQMPCFCYCNRFGHTSLQDCFTTNHAEYCDICLREAIEADQMENQGLTAQEIRAVIISKYHRKHTE